MSQRSFEKLNDKGSQLIAESNRITDITDSKWGHPDGADFWYIDPALNVETATLYNPEVSDEEKLKLGKKRQQAYYDQWWSTEHTCDIEKHEVPGCEEEPDTPVEVWVVKPKNIKPRKNRVLYYVVGGALVSLNPNAYPMSDFVRNINALVLFRFIDFHGRQSIRLQSMTYMQHINGWMTMRICLVFIQTKLY
mgnify:CR=1 FL=1